MDSTEICDDKKNVVSSDAPWTAKTDSMAPNSNGSLVRPSARQSSYIILGSRVHSSRTPTEHQVLRDDIDDLSIAVFRQYRMRVE
jgi:hypothetical protein